MNKSAQELGKLGGAATFSKYGKGYYAAIAKGWPKGKKRVKKTLISKFDPNELTIGDIRKRYNEN